MNQRLDVSGHRELRLRPYDATRDRATDNPVFDERLLAIYDRFANAGYDPDELQAFCRLLTSICRAGLSMTWDKSTAVACTSRNATSTTSFTTG